MGNYSLLEFLVRASYWDVLSLAMKKDVCINSRGKREILLQLCSHESKLTTLKRHSPGASVKLYIEKNKMFLCQHFADVAIKYNVY